MTIRTDGADWIVEANWHGATRTVCRGTIWKCLQYVSAIRRNPTKVH